MKNLHNKQYSKSLVRELAVPILVFALVMAILGFGIGYINKTNNEQNINLLRQAVNRTAVECYSVEGIYPPSVEYMEENYGLNYDHSKYFVFYDIFASNIMPTIEVYEKQ